MYTFVCFYRSVHPHSVLVLLNGCITQFIGQSFLRLYKIEQLLCRLTLWAITFYPATGSHLALGLTHKLWNYSQRKKNTSDHVARQIMKDLSLYKYEEI